ncbi:MAG: hypothetical protein GXY55_02340 [Phycisphaerae bacterium]|nr:hypothetical protein [Phycisphaerae bacterium]
MTATIKRIAFPTIILSMPTPPFFIPGGFSQRKPGGRILARHNTHLPSPGKPLAKINASGPIDTLISLEKVEQ